MAAGLWTKIIIDEYSVMESVRLLIVRPKQRHNQGESTTSCLNSGNVIFLVKFVLLFHPTVVRIRCPLTFQSC